ncbi:MAG TPA: trypsin-like peptidase domain-containing protein [Chloroflexia bacterium]|nr:trypsin-like peptidase domain-containing protein [Chloroflexia bacterium]
MKPIERKINIGLATGLLIMLLTFGGMTVANNGITGGVATVLSPVQVALQQVATGNTLATTTGTGTLDTQITSAVTGQAEQGVIDARYAVHQAGSAVVTVVNTMQVATRGRSGQTRTAEALGSGVIIDSRGYIVTNQHVVANQQSLQVIFADGTKVNATLVGEDASMDIAVLKVEAKVPAVAQLGDSDKLELGQPVVAIGTALGDFANTVTVGIVSGLHRQLDDASTSIQDLVQTDAAINHGNSGGPLLDLNGNVIGINTAVVRNDGTMGSVAEGLGFAIPSNTVKTVIERLTN